MSRSNYDKPYYVDVGTSIVAVRCASNHDVVLEYDHSRHPFVIELAEKACDRMNREAEIGRPRGSAAKLREVCEKMLDLLTAEGFEDGGMSIELDEKQVIMWRNRFRATLAAPPRNCDKYTSLDEARNAYMAISEMPEGNRDEDVRQWLCDFHHWLFAPATEKEGGNNGNE